MAKVKIFVELDGDDVVTIPEWVKTGEDLKNFVTEYARENIDINYQIISKSMDREEFVEKVTVLYQNALIRGLEDISITVYDDANSTYHIVETNEGYGCDEIECYSDDIEDMAHAVYDHKKGNIVEVI